MLRIKITRNGDYVKKITFTGHADYSSYGQDIVCAACSATMLCTVNGILSINNQAIEVFSGDDKQVINVLSTDSITIKLIDNMIRCFESLEAKYPKNIKLK